METQTLGRGMMILACAVGMGLLTVFFAGVEDRQRNPNQLPISQSSQAQHQVELTRNRAGH
jgi:aspartyl protease family protein